jgi:uncharacterized membrane protein YidH (DUF202 family)
MIESIDILRIFQVFIVAFGGVVVYFGANSYRRSKSKSMLFLALGFMFVTIGAVASGVLFEVLKYTLVDVETVEAGSEVIGFFLIVYSILGTKE